MISILNILFYHPVSEATPNSKITGAYCPRAAAGMWFSYERSFVFWFEHSRELTGMVVMEQNLHTVQKLLNRIDSAWVICRHCFRSI
jgi:hypothetical protein